MKRFKYHIITAFLIVSALLHGCMDELVAPDNNINGVIYDKYGFVKSNFSGTTIISAGDYPITYTFLTPYFSLNSILKPYSLHIYSPYDSGYALQPSILKYIGITTNNPKIVDYDENYQEDHFNIIQCLVKFPALESQKTIYFKFVSPENFVQNYYTTSGSKGLDNVLFRIYISKYSSQINGKLYFMEATVDFFNGVKSYDKFGSKELTLRHGYSEEIVLTPNEISYNPPEMISNISVIYPENSFTRRIYVGLGSQDFNKPSEMNLYGTNQTSMRTIVPILPDNGFKIRFYSSYRTASFLPFDEYAEKWIYVDPGEDAEIVHTNVIQIISPEDNATEVGLNTVFEINDESEQGIYTYDILRVSYEDLRCLRILTDKKKLQMSDFIIRGFEYHPNRRYEWNVKKYLGYNSMDEFVSGVYTIDKKYSILSEGRTFTTAP